MQRSVKVNLLNLEFKEEAISVLYYVMSMQGMEAVCIVVHLGCVDDDVDGAVEGEQHVVEPGQWSANQRGVLWSRDQQPCSHWLPGQRVYPLGPVLDLPERVHLRISDIARSISMLKGKM